MKKDIKTDLDPKEYGLTAPDGKVFFDASRFKSCPVCHSSGQVIKDGKEITCPTCNGTTAIPKNEVIKTS